MSSLRFCDKRSSRVRSAVLTGSAVLLVWMAVAPGIAHADEDVLPVMEEVRDEQTVETSAEQPRAQVAEHSATETAASDSMSASSDSSRIEGADADDVIGGADNESEGDGANLPTGLLADGESFIYRHNDGAQAKSEWVTIDGATYYFGESGRALRWGQKLIGEDGAEHFYYFDKNCRMVTGWITWNNDGTKSYFGDDGAALLGWRTIGKERYFFNPSTGRSYRWSHDIDGAQYYFNAQSQMVRGLVTWNADGLKSYFGDDGKRRTGWVQTNGKWYYFDPSTGKSVRWSQYINGNWFYFNEKCEMHTGLLTWNKDGLKSYFDPKTGRRQTGWKETSPRVWYYFSPSTGKSLRWHQRIDGNWFYFDANYQMHRGWLKWNGVQKWSYFYDNGRQAFGAQTIGGFRYVFDKDGETTTKPVTVPADQRAMITKAQNYYSDTSYLILVNSKTHKVGVFKGSSYNWQLVWYWNCTTGAPGSPTVKGTYKVGSRGKSFGSGYTCWYWTQFYGNYLFHSVLYQPGSMSRIQDGRLGISASHGCVRLDIECARWIYNNIPTRTRVVSY